jgi:sugar-phosphatase
MASSHTAPSVEIPCQGILFDMDGILISSLGSVERCWTKWANKHGIDPEYACRMAHGCRCIDTVALLRPDLDAEAEHDLIEGMEAPRIGWRAYGWPRAAFRCRSGSSRRKA